MNFQFGERGKGKLLFYKFKFCNEIKKQIERRFKCIVEIKEDELSFKPDLIFDFRFIKIGLNFNKIDLEKMLEVMNSGVYTKEQINDHILNYIDRDVIPRIERNILSSIRRENY